MPCEEALDPAARGPVHPPREVLRRRTGDLGPCTAAGAEGMVGERAEVIGPGRVRVRGEIWNARGEEGRGPGEAVRVAGVEGLTLVVEPEPRV